MLVNDSFLTSVRRLCQTLVFLAGIILIVASGGGGGDGDSGASNTNTTDNSSTDTTDDATNSTYDPEDLPTGTSFEYVDDDLNPTTITLGSGAITGDTEHATSIGNVVMINYPGTYYIVGTTTDGQINVDTLETGDVRLVLQGIDISCSTGPPIDIENAERVIIHLETGTDNYLTDVHTSEVLDEDGEEIDAAIYSKEDLVICGEGTLTINTNYKDGIKSKDGLIIDSGTIHVTSADDGIIGKNYISVEGGNIYIIAGGDGMKSTNDGDSTQGYIYVLDGLLDINAGADAVQVETHIVIEGGEFDLYTAGGSNTVLNLNTETAKGLKSPVGITIYDGIFSIDSADDSIHSNDTIVLNGGAYSLYSGDDAIHADQAVTVNSGVIDVFECYEGIEGMVITINDGEIHVQSQDDPINATDGHRGENDPGVCIYINGGYSYFECVNADGFDSNGAVVMTGGTVIINGPVSGSNGILDYGTFTMNGGTIIGAGTSNMAQAPGDASSTQNGLLIGFNQRAAGTLFHLETSGGTDVLTFAPAKAYESIVYSSPALEGGTTLKAYFGGTYTGGSVKDGLYTDGTYSGGVEAGSITVSSID
jgi:hypothetical protein